MIHKQNYRLRSARIKSGFSQEEMANMLGYQSKNAYSLKERGKRRFYVNEAITVSKILNIPVENLFAEMR